MTQDYNVGGRTFPTYTRSCDDPCGYVTDTPCRVLALVNESVSTSLLNTVRVTETQDIDTEVTRIAWQRHNLVRELAVRAGNAGDINTRQLMLARIRRVIA